MVPQQLVLRPGRRPAWLLLIAVLWPVAGTAISRPGQSPQRVPLQFEYLAGQPGLSRSRVWCIEQDRAGFMWFGTENGHHATVFRSDDVADIHADRQGRLWVATQGGGLHQVDLRTGRVTAHPVAALPKSGWHNHFSLLEDRQGVLWIGVAAGIARLEPRTGQFTLYPTPNGKAMVQPRAAARGAGDRLLLGTKNGGGVFHPGQLRHRTELPPVRITGIRVMERSRFPAGDTLELPHDENFLSFEYAALNYTPAGKNRYAYHLEGIGLGWVNAGTRRYVSCPNLPPGTDTFRVRSAGDDGLLPAAATSLTVFIHPPWWRTGWAYGAYAAGLLVLLGLARWEIIRRERLQASLEIERVAAEKLRELDALKSQFFANISHEFRTPLAVITGTVEKLGREDASLAERRRDYQTIDRYAGRLLQLINQLLDLSQLDARKLALQPQPGDLAAFLGFVTDSFASLFAHKQITYRCHLPGLLLWVQYDADGLQKILTNLLSNALKFTPEGGSVEVTVEADRRDEARTALQIVVRDTGIGIPADQLPRVFDRFYQADASLTRAYEGTGIGLTLVKELVALHGGTLGVESTTGRGTTFTVRLPLANCPPVADGETAKGGRCAGTGCPAGGVGEEAGEAPAPQGRLPVQLLVVEDNADLRYFISRQLGSQYRVLAEADGRKGWERATQAVPDLIISDVMMPGMDGVSLCRKLKSDPRTRHIPVILLTARANPESRLRGLQHGADDYLTKPFGLGELEARVKNLLESRRTRPAPVKPFAPGPREVVAPSADDRFLRRALEIMEVHMGNAAFDVETFSREAGLSRAHLHRKLTALAGMAPNEFIRTMRLKRAASLLEQHSGNVSEIAYQVGFSTLNYFTKCFRRQYGQTPSEYLASHGPFQPRNPPQ